MYANRTTTRVQDTDVRTYICGNLSPTMWVLMYVVTGKTLVCSEWQKGGQPELVTNVSPFCVCVPTYLRTYVHSCDMYATDVRR